MEQHDATSSDRHNPNLGGAKCNSVVFDGLAGLRRYPRAVHSRAFDWAAPTKKPRPWGRPGHCRSPHAQSGGRGTCARITGFWRWS